MCCHFLFQHRHPAPAEHGGTLVIIRSNLEETRTTLRRVDCADFTTETRKQLNREKSSDWSFCSVFTALASVSRHMPWFAALHFLVFSSCTVEHVKESECRYSMLVSKSRKPKQKRDQRERTKTTEFSDVNWNIPAAVVHVNTLFGKLSSSKTQL